VKTEAKRTKVRKKVDGAVNRRPLNRERQLMGRKLLGPRRFGGWAAMWRRDTREN
jgi:hypothetical protein